MEQTKERLTYIDMVKGFSMLCIIIGHLLPLNYNVVCLTTPFHVPIYYVISGFLFHYKEEEIDIKTNLKKMVKSLLIPYFFFSIVIILIELVRIGPDYAIKLVKATVDFSGIAALWFIPSLIVTRLVFVASLNMKNKWIRIGIIVLPLIFILAGCKEPENRTLFVLYRSFLTTPFFAIGYYSEKWMRKIEIPTLALMAFAGLGIFLSYLNGPFYVFCAKSDCLWISTLLAIIISISIILLFKKMPEIKFLSFCGKNSLILLATHQMISIVILQILIEMRVEHRKAVFLILFLMIEYGTIYICNRFLPFCIRKK